MATKTKSKARKSSTAPSKQTLRKDPFKAVRDFRDSIDKTADKLYDEGTPESAELLRFLGRQIDLGLPEATAQYEKRRIEDAQLAQDREQREAAVRKARA